MENRALCLSRSRFHFSSVGPCEKKKNTAKGKEAFQGKFVVIVERFAGYFFGGKPLEFLPVHSHCVWLEVGSIFRKRDMKE